MGQRCARVKAGAGEHAGSGAFEGTRGFRAGAHAAEGTDFETRLLKARRAESTGWWTGGLRRGHSAAVQGRRAWSLKQACSRNAGRRARAGGLTRCGQRRAKGGCVEGEAGQHDGTGVLAVNMKQQCRLGQLAGGMSMPRPARGERRAGHLQGRKCAG